MRYALVDVMLEDEQASPDIRRFARVVKRSLREHHGIYVRPLVSPALQTTRGARRSHAAGAAPDRTTRSVGHILRSRVAAYFDQGTLVR